MSDAIEVVIGTGGYLLKNTVAARELRKSPGWEQQTEADQAADPAPPLATVKGPFTS